MEYETKTNCSQIPWDGTRGRARSLTARMLWGSTMSSSWEKEDTQQEGSSKDRETTVMEGRIVTGNGPG